MSYEILWTGPALQDLRSIKRYISKEGRPEAAKRLATRLRNRAESLAEYPQAGRRVPEFPDSDLRELIVNPYRIVYETSRDCVIILRVWHGRRDLQGLET